MVDEVRSGFLNNSRQMNMFSALILKPRSLYLPWERYQRPLVSETYISLPFFPNSEKGPEWQSMRDRTTNETNPTVIENFAKEQELSNIVLTPSPGEQFWLKIDCRDGFLQTVSADLSIEVSSPTHEPVWLIERYGWHGRKRTFCKSLCHLFQKRIVTGREGRKWDANVWNFTTKVREKALQMKKLSSNCSFFRKARWCWCESPHVFVAAAVKRKACWLSQELCINYILSWSNGVCIPQIARFMDWTAESKSLMSSLLQYNTVLLQSNQNA